MAPSASHRFLPLILVTLGAAQLAHGQTSTSLNPVGTPGASTETAVGTSKAAAPKRPRAISGEAASALAAAMPKFEPPKPVEKKPVVVEEEELPDMRDIDKPRNGIIRLEKFIVREAKPPVFRERDINTSAGIAAIAMRRYVSETGLALNRYTLPIIGSALKAYTLQRYADDERLKNMADLSDAANTASRSDAAAGTYINRESEKTYMRSRDFGWSNDAKK